MVIADAAQANAAAAAAASTVGKDVLGHVIRNAAAAHATSITGRRCAW